MDSRWGKNRPTFRSPICRRSASSRNTVIDFTESRGPTCRSASSVSMAGGRASSGFRHPGDSRIEAGRTRDGPGAHRATILIRLRRRSSTVVVLGDPAAYSGSRLHDTLSGVPKPAEDVLGCDLSGREKEGKRKGGIGIWKRKGGRERGKRKGGREKGEEKGGRRKGGREKGEGKRGKSSLKGKKGDILLFAVSHREGEAKGRGSQRGHGKEGQKGTFCFFRKKATFCFFQARRSKLRLEKREQAHALQGVFPWVTLDFRRSTRLRGGS